MPDTILQREIEAVRRLAAVYDEAVLTLRRRLRAGARVEPGELMVDDTLASTIEEYEAVQPESVENCGLTIAPAGVMHAN